VGDQVLVLRFDPPAALAAQRAYVDKGALFVPAPDPLPEPFAELDVRIDAGPGLRVQTRTRVVQMSPQGIALAFVDLGAAKAALQPLFDAVGTVAPGASLPRPAVTWLAAGEPEVPAAAAPAAGPADSPDDAGDAPDGSDSAPEAEGDALLYDRIRAMTSQEKIHLALHGDRSARLILMKDVNKTVQTFLVQNPRITLDEIRYIAGFRQANPDVLATIGAHREWGVNAGIVAALIRNPKTPSTTAIKLLDRVTPAELRRLAKSGDVPRAVQVVARKRVTD
jgi:hypothetical protein